MLYYFQHLIYQHQNFADKTLRERLLEISKAVYELNADDIGYVFGYPDDLKFRSCMTLFMLIAPEESIFKMNLDRYFDGEVCEHTVNLFAEENS